MPRIVAGHNRVNEYSRFWSLIPSTPLALADTIHAGVGSRLARPTGNLQDRSSIHTAYKTIHRVMFWPCYEPVSSELNSVHQPPFGFRFSRRGASAYLFLTQAINEKEATGAYKGAAQTQNGQKDKQETESDKKEKLGVADKQKPEV